MSGLFGSRLDWERDGRDWPNRDASRFVTCGTTRWHIQTMGQAMGAEAAPVMLLVHGTGASTHSFRDLMPLLSTDFHVVAPDLPGHGFTRVANSDSLSLQGMAAEISVLLKALEVAPTMAVGHSAGAAILLQLVLKGYIAPKRIIGVNSALRPMYGHAVFSPMAKLLYLNSLVPRLMSLRARYGDAAANVLSMTGSHIDADGARFYRLLFESPSHVSGALGMMANWDLEALQDKMPTLQIPLTLVVAEDDPMVSPSVSRHAAELVPGAEMITVKEGGHLFHEVDPQRLVEIVRERAT